MGGLWSSSEQEAESSLVKPKSVNLNDPYAVKRQLDDSTCEIIIRRGYLEDMTLSNLKMAVGVVTCSVALVAQFYPKKFPDNQSILLTCIYIAIFKEKNHILLTHPRTGSFTQTGLAVSSRMARYSDAFTLRIASSDPSSIAAHEPVELTKSVTDWFTSEGHLAEDIYAEDVGKLLDQYESESRKSR
eukprot:jgi/Mesen1/4167/ME000219S03293